MEEGSGPLKGKRVVVGVTGGIAAYKSAELVRLLVRAGADTRVVMTLHATKFIGPMTFEALSRNKVIWDMWSGSASPMDHINWGQGSDLIVVAPATANLISKLAHGMADDFLSTMLLAATARILVCPAMNTCMYENPAVQQNLRLLQERGVALMAPSAGELACGTEGPGRLPDPPEILEEASFLLSPKDLAGLKVVVTAGPTLEPIDPVRYITNRSSGKMGYAIARAARMRGADVVLISGPTHLEPPAGVPCKRVRTTEEMRKEVLDRFESCDVVIKAAAVLDYRPREAAPQKIKKGDRPVSLELRPNPDILAELGSLKGSRPCTLVGFAAETNDLLSNARAKLERKNLDMIVANDVTAADAGFDSDTNRVKVLFRDGSVEDWPLLSKQQVANRLLDRIQEWRGTSG
jgi:phosphopantothenoylcysteine decarboxylase / phosphopantothenate---cysteine ligase